MGVGTKRARTDWLREMYGLLVFTAVVVLGGILFTLVRAIAGPVTCPAATDHVFNPPAGAGLTGGLRLGVTLDSAGTIDLVIRHPTAGQSALYAVGALPTALLALVMIGFLLRIVGMARRDPFTPTTVRRLRQLGITLVIAGPLAAGVRFSAQFLLVDSVTTRGAAGTLTLGEPLLWVIVGLGCLAIAQVVRRGTELSAELSEVI